ncbi:MAG: Bug family tripartite tricarboxylate transporter substrate binding protein [Hyphomicrobiaceae bacterium]
MLLRFCAALTAAFIALCGTASAQGNKPIRLIVAFPPGGPVDFVARLLVDPLSRDLGQPVIVENRAGANGSIAAELVAKGPADGSVIFLTSSGAVVINPSLYPNLPYDPMKDFTPVSRVINSDTVLVVHPSNTSSDAAAFAEASRGLSQPVPIGSAGIGSTTHLALELFQGASRASLLHVPYKGAAPVITDLINNQVGGFFGDLPGIITHIQGGKLKPIGIAAPKRHALLPDVKTFAELGFPGTESNNWYAMVVRTGTPRAFIDKLNAALKTALTTEPVQSKLINAGAVPDPSTPEEMTEVMTRDTEKFARIIREKQIKVE